MASQSYFIVLTVRTRDVRNHDTLMASKSYFIALTVRTHDVQNHDRLPPVWGLLRLSPIAVIQGMPSKYFICIEVKF